jgi:CBS domain-containing protein
VNSLVVRPEGREDPFGIITSTDIVDAVADGLDPTLAMVRDVATAPLVTVTPGVPVAYAARLMKRANLRHLAVFNGREVVGILSGYDIVKAIGRWGILAATLEEGEEVELTSAVSD